MVAATNWITRVIPMPELEIDCQIASMLAGKLEESSANEIECTLREQFKTHVQSPDSCRPLREQKRSLISSLNIAGRQILRSGIPIEGMFQSARRVSFPLRIAQSRLATATTVCMALCLVAVAAWPRWFAQPAAFRAAAATLDQGLQHSHASWEQHNGVGYSRATALSDARLHRVAMSAATWWMSEFASPHVELLPNLTGRFYWMLGQPELGPEHLKRVLENIPLSHFRPSIEVLFDEPISAAPVAEPQSGTIHQLRSNAEAQDFNAKKQDGYLVVEVGLVVDNPAHDGFRSVAQRVRQFHSADVVTFDGRDFDHLQSVIDRHRPRNVLFVIPPAVLDVNFQRQVFLLSPTLDNDLMTDFAWGYLTARDGEAVNQLWDRIEWLHQHGLANRTWTETAVISGGAKSYRLDRYPNEHVARAGFGGTHLYFGFQSNDPDVLTFFDANKLQLEQASVIAMSGNGDPQGIWLFDDRRNLDRSKHWPFEPAKVGFDPENQMARITAERFRALKLNRPIIWSGTCHSGACKRVFVEADIVSTFGTSDRVELYEMQPDESLCLAFIDAGAAALLVPIASNHGMSCMMEQQFALENGATLGETIKSTYDDVFFQAAGLPNIKIVQAGESAHYSEPIMQGGGANRILIGDPELKLFTPTPAPGESIKVEWDAKANELVVTVDWEKGFHATGWNMFGEDRTANYRIKTRVALDQELASHGEQFAAQLSKLSRTPTVSCTIVDGTQAPIECHPRCVVESFAGQTYLHLQASMSRDPNYQSSFTATFRIPLDK